MVKGYSYPEDEWDHVCKVFVTCYTKATDAGNRMQLIPTMDLLAAEAGETHQDKKWDPSQQSQCEEQRPGQTPTFRVCRKKTKKTQRLREKGISRRKKRQVGKSCKMAKINNWGLRMGAWNSRLKSFWRYLRRNKDGRERSQRAGAKDGADERVEGVNVQSPGRGCWAGTGERDRGSQEQKFARVKVACCRAAHSRPVSSSSILPSSVKTRAFLEWVRRLRERSTKGILVTAPWQCWEGTERGLPVCRAFYTHQLPWSRDSDRQAPSLHHRGGACGQRSPALVQGHTTQPRS